MTSVCFCASLSLTLIRPEQLSAIWKYGIFTQCIKADCTCYENVFTTAFYGICIPYTVNVSLQSALLLGFHPFLSWHN